MESMVRSSMLTINIVNSGREVSAWVPHTPFMCVAETTEAAIGKLILLLDNSRRLGGFQADVKLVGLAAPRSFEDVVKGEVDAVVETVKDDAYQEGYDDGYTEGKYASS